MALRKDVSKRQELASQGHWDGRGGGEGELSVEIRSAAENAADNRSEAQMDVVNCRLASNEVVAEKAGEVRLVS